MPATLSREPLATSHIGDERPSAAATAVAGAAGWASRRLVLWLGAGTLALLALAVALVLLLALAWLGSSTLSQTGNPAVYGTSRFALADIPPNYLAAYQQAGRDGGIDWAVLAGIGKIECDHGRHPNPACTQPGAENNAGAGGPMQFLAATWAQYGIDGDRDGSKDRWNPRDAIPAAARYLRAAGAPRDYRRAIYAYNHANWYVDQVLDYASRYRGSVDAGAEAGQAPEVAGARARVDSTGLALAPAAAPAAVKRIIAAGNRIGARPYHYGGGHPDFLHDHGLDCSSSTSYLLFAGGVYPSTSAIVSGDFAHWGEPGPGRWVTIYANSGHVFTVTAGLRNDTGRYDTGPNASESGPRWRLGPRPTAGFTIRHPPGL